MLSILILNLIVSVSHSNSVTVACNTLNGLTLQYCEHVPGCKLSSTGTECVDDPCWPQSPGSCGSDCKDATFEGTSVCIDTDSYIDTCNNGQDGQTCGAGCYSHVVRVLDGSVYEGVCFNFSQVLSYTVDCTTLVGVYAPYCEHFPSCKIGNTPGTCEFDTCVYLSPPCSGSCTASSFSGNASCISTGRSFDQCGGQVSGCTGDCHDHRIETLTGDIYNGCFGFPQKETCATVTTFSQPDCNAAVGCAWDPIASECGEDVWYRSEVGCSDFTGSYLEWCDYVPSCGVSEGTCVYDTCVDSSTFTTTPSTCPGNCKEAEWKGVSICVKESKVLDTCFDARLSQSNLICELPCARTTVTSPAVGPVYTCYTDETPAISCTASTPAVCNATQYCAWDPIGNECKEDVWYYSSVACNQFKGPWLQYCDFVPSCGINSASVCERDTCILSSTFSATLISSCPTGCREDKWGDLSICVKTSKVLDSCFDATMNQSHLYCPANCVSAVIPTEAVGTVYACASTAGPTGPVCTASSAPTCNSIAGCIWKGAACVEDVWYRTDVGCSQFTGEWFQYCDSVPSCGVSGSVCVYDTCVSSSTFSSTVLSVCPTDCKRETWQGLSICVKTSKVLDTCFDARLNQSNLICPAPCVSSAVPTEALGTVYDCATPPPPTCSTSNCGLCDQTSCPASNCLWKGAQCVDRVCTTDTCAECASSSACTGVACTWVEGEGCKTSSWSEDRSALVRVPVSAALLLLALLLSLLL